MNYNKHFDRDEIDDIKCTGCGIPCLATDIENGLCPLCLEMTANQENLNFAREEFEKVMNTVMTQPLQKLKAPFFAFGYLMSKFLRIAKEDDLWDVTNAVTQHIKTIKEE